MKQRELLNILSDEAFTGDIPSFEKTAAVEALEEKMLNKALYGLEAVIAHNESDLSTWTSHEYDLNLI